MLFAETCNEGRESSPWGKNLAESLGHTTECGEASANKTCPNPLRYSVTFMQHFIVSYCPDHVRLAIKRLSNLCVIGKVRWHHFQPGISELTEKRDSFLPKSFLSRKE